MPFLLSLEVTYCCNGVCSDFIIVILEKRELYISAMKGCREGKVLAPHIFNLCISLWLVVSFTPQPHYPWGKDCGTHKIGDSRSGLSKKIKIISYCRKLTPDSPSRGPVSIRLCQPRCFISTCTLHNAIWPYQVWIKTCSLYAVWAKQRNSCISEFQNST